MAWVFDHETETSGSERLVLLSLANHAREVEGRWECYPGIDRIGREAGIARRGTVKDSLRRLEAKGLIVRVVNAAPDSRIRADRRPNLYLLNFGDGSPDSGEARGGTLTDLPSEDHGGSVSVVTGGRVSRSRGVGFRTDGGSVSVPLSISEPSEEPSLDPRALAPLEATETLVVFGADAHALFFDAFWAAYPRKAAKASALRAWGKAMKLGVDAGVIVEGAVRYRDDPNREDQFTAHPASWLNAGRWDDDPLPSRGPEKANLGALLKSAETMSDEEFRAALGMEQKGAARNGF